jgi:hypothetical protein
MILLLLYLFDNAQVKLMIFLFGSIKDGMTVSDDVSLRSDSSNSYCV